jgi:nitrogen regulatory protein P-II 1
MKEIKAVIQPQRLARVREAVRRIPDFPGMTVTPAEGSGYHPDRPRASDIKTELTDYSRKVRLEIVAPDEQVAALVSLIRNTCHTGQPGDGVVWVTAVEQFHRIRDST